MSHIPPDKLLPQDLVDMHDHGPVDRRFAAPAAHRMHASDARHAMDVEPRRFTLAGDLPPDDRPAKPAKPAKPVEV